MGLFSSSCTGYERIRDDDEGNPLQYLPKPELSLDIQWDQAKKVSSYSISAANHYACSVVAYAMGKYTQDPFSIMMLIPFLLFPAFVSLISPIDDQVIPKIPQLLTLMSASLLGMILHNLDNHILYTLIAVSVILLSVQSVAWLFRYRLNTMTCISCRM